MTNATKLIFIWGGAQLAVDVNRLALYFLKQTNLMKAF